MILWLRFLCAVLLASAPFVVADEAMAQSCSVFPNDINSGNVAAGDQSYVFSTTNYSCTGVPNATINICLYIGAGTGGALPSGPRRMAFGANRLDFDLYSNIFLTARFATGVVTTANQLYPLTLDASGNGSGFGVVIGYFGGPQSRVPPGTYSSTFSGSTQLEYGYSTTFNSCAAAGATILPFTLRATATIQPACSVTTADVAFGTVSSLASNTDATGAVNVTCSSGTAFTVSLDGGTMAAADGTSRKLTSGARQVTYGLYRDAGRTQPWYNSAGTTSSGTGNGSTQSLPVYGRAPAQVTPAPGSYSDRVIVVVSY